MIEIKPANVRDACFIAGNMREWDRKEIFCQLPDGATSQQVGSAILGYGDTRWTFIAYYKGQPIGVFGFEWLNVCTLSAWAWGTNRLWRAVPAITRKQEQLTQEFIDAGVARIEARSLQGHDDADRWLKRLGATIACELPNFGKNGETFNLWVSQIGGRNVFQETKT